jgi:DNA-binding response OmpR family regulator
MMLSAKTQRADRERCREAGALAYVTKPFSPLELTALVETLAELTPSEVSAMRAGERSLSA